MQTHTAQTNRTYTSRRHGCGYGVFRKIDDGTLFMVYWSQSSLDAMRKAEELELAHQRSRRPSHTDKGAQTR